jgi:hypothetical protein
MRDLVNLRWAEDVSHHLDSLQSQVRQFSPDRESNCRVHPDEKQNIYCNDCDACICHKCALFTGRHVGHKFRELDDVYQEHVGIVETEIRGLKAYLSELIETMNDVVSCHIVAVLCVCLSVCLSIAMSIVCVNSCRVHPDEKQNIYCNDCDACICHKCALFTGRHVGHKFRELDDVYQEHVGIVETEIRGLKAYLSELIETMNDVDQNLGCVREGREEAFQRMHQAWVMVCERLDADFKERLQTLKDCSNTLDKHKGMIEILLRDIECQVKSLGRTELIRKSSGLQKRIQKVVGG